MILFKLSKRVLSACNFACDSCNNFLFFSLSATADTLCKFVYQRVYQAKRHIQIYNAKLCSYVANMDSGTISNDLSQRIRKSHKFHKAANHAAFLFQNVAIHFKKAHNSCVPKRVAKAFVPKNVGYTRYAFLTFYVYPRKYLKPEY